MRALVSFLVLTLATVALASPRILDVDSLRSADTTKVWTLPSVSDQVCGIADTVTLTNKSISGATNTFSAIPVGAIAGGALSGSNSGDVTASAFGAAPNANGFTLTGQAFNLEPADATHPGGLLAADWVTFNGKQAAGSYITSLTTDVVAAGPGASVATIQANVVTNAKLAQMPTNTIKGNNTGGTANALDLTVAQVNTLLGTVTNVTASAPLASSGGATPNLSLTGVVAVANGGTNSSTALNNNRVMESIGGAIVEAAAITANRALVSNASGLPIASSVTDTTLAFLDATSSVQTQLNGKQATGNYITALTGDVTASGPGSVAATLANTAVTPGSYTSADITVDSKGRITAAANGSGGGGTITDELRLDTANGYGSTNTFIRRFSTVTTNTTSGTYVDSATLGGSFTVVTAGLYTIDYADSINGGTGLSGFCATLNDPSVSTACLAQATGTTATLMQIASPPDAGLGGYPARGSWTGRLAVNDVIRFKTQGGPNPSPNITTAKITRIGN